MPRKKLNNEQVHEICKLLMDGAKNNDIVAQYHISVAIVSNIKYKKSYRDITSLYDLEETWVSRNSSSKLYSDKFIDFILECIKNNTPIDEIISDERCEISDKDSLSHYISRLRTGRLHRNKLIKNKMYHDDINNPINNNIISDDIVISIANDIKSNPKSNIKELSEKYDIKPIAISMIKTGKSFTNITSIEQSPALRSFANTDIIINIANEIKTNPSISNIELAKKYNIEKSIISDIRNGKVYSDITAYRCAVGPSLRERLGRPWGGLAALRTLCHVRILRHPRASF